MNDRRELPAQVATERARIEPMLARLREATPEQVAADPELRGFALAGGRGAFAQPEAVDEAKVGGERDVVIVRVRIAGDIDSVIGEDGYAHAGSGRARGVPETRPAG